MIQARMSTIGPLIATGLTSAKANVVILESDEYGILGRNDSCSTMSALDSASLSGLNATPAKRREGRHYVVQVDS